jgi:TRAP-type transport system periplasmic protein
MMKKNKNISVLFLAIMMSLVIVIAGCGKEKSTTGGTGEDPIELQLATNLPAQHPITLNYEKIAKDVAGKSDGRLVIKVFPSEQLGKEKDVTDSISNKTGDMAAIGPGEMARRYTPILIFDAPYVFESPEHMLAFSTSEEGKKIWDEFAKKTNLRNLGMFYYGTRHVTTSKVVAKTPEDMDGLKLRVPDQPMPLAYGKALGAQPTPMALGEVYLALQQGVVDGQENPIATIISNKFNEVQKNLILTGHVLASIGFVISEQKYQSIPEDLKEILTTAIQEGVKTISKEVEQDEAKQIEEMKKAGMNIVEPDKEAFKESAKELIEKYEAEWGEGLYEKVQAVK